MRDDRTPAQKKANYTGGRAKDPSKLSTKPSQIRNRLRRKGKKLEEDVRLYGEHAWGKQIEDFDLEELARGRPRAANGTFQGGRPKWLTPILQNEMKKRLMEKTYGMMAGHLEIAVKVMFELMTSEEIDLNGKPIVDARTKFAAAQFIIEHMIGKPQAMIKLETEISVAKEAIAAAIVLDDGQPQGHLAIEGEWTEADDEEDEEDDDLDGE